MTKDTPLETSNKHEAYFIPANVNKSFTTTEFQHNFNQNESVSFANETLTANYLTGKKILNQSIIPSDSNFKAYVTQQAQDNQETTNIKLTSITPIKTITKLYLSEREGNEYVLIDEVKKFKEFLDLNSIIHG
ncbi:similar to Torulaspora delbrueckii TDEL_0C05700 hypothetical protein [Maudiozyma saulgeensis]|uniref:Uncharacterized protein n=1 Tax=Maudiozyma saulgeensis TaxID=1789683 RepID=A0A1X7R3V8_9SACH|nr:similar to Torulaspora delbrueckii TDEL_0C05700 hypothetical protein [Kazachstania saulgeensis]